MVPLAWSAASMTRVNGDPAAALSTMTELIVMVLLALCRNSSPVPVP